MGGGYSLELALAEPGLAGAVIYYGSLVTDDAKIAGLKVPLLGNFGGKDQGIPPESVREFERKAKAHGKSRGLQDLPGGGTRVRVVEGSEESTARKTRRTPTPARTRSWRKY